MNIRCTGALQLSSREAGVSPSTVRSHLTTDPVFKAAYDEAMNDFKEHVETEIYRRAISGWDEEVYQQGEYVGTIRKFDSRLLELLAKRHIPEYKEKFEVQHHLPPGTLVVPIKQSEEEWMKDVSEAEIVEEPVPEVLPSPSEGEGSSFSDE